MYYNAKRRHGLNNQLSPVVALEKRYAMSLQGVGIIRGDPSGPYVYRKV
jgi:hypothetical protein